MGSLFHVHPFIVLFVFLFFVVVSVVQILRRTGHNPVWCLLALVPGLNLLAFWFLAFKQWPTDKKPANEEQSDLSNARQWVPKLTRLTSWGYTNYTE
jgi:hypothetical protein